MARTTKPEQRLIDYLDQALAQERARDEARRNAQHETHVPLEFCCCINCQERRLADQAMENLPY